MSKKVQRYKAQTCGAQAIYVRDPGGDMVAWVEYTLLEKELISEKANGEYLSAKIDALEKERDNRGRGTSI